MNPQVLICGYGATGAVAASLLGQRGRPGARPKGPGGLLPVDDSVTPVETLVAGGIGFEAPFGCKHDLAGIGVAWSDPSPGEGGRDETLAELLYRIELAKAISITPDLRLVLDPADNADDDFVVVPGVRLQLVF